MQYFIPSDDDRDGVEDNYDVDNKPKKAELSTLAKDIKSIYEDRKGRRSSGTMDKQFNKAADICQSLLADPFQYVAAQFHNRDPLLVYVGHLHAHDAGSRYMKYIEEFEASQIELYDQYLRVLSRQINLGRTVEWILGTEHLPFPAWFRICITKDPIPEVIKKYKAAALLEVDKPLLDFLREKNLDYKRITQ